MSLGEKLPRHELRRMVSEEALSRIDELENQQTRLKAVNNRQAAAMEAIANAITAYALENEAMRVRLDALERVYWRRVVLAVGRWLKRIADWCADKYWEWTPVSRPDGWVYGPVKGRSGRSNGRHHDRH
jgi:hypothetical protein